MSARTREILDLVLLALLGTVALAGLASTFTGWEFLGVGVAGLVLGLLTGPLAARLRLPLVAPVLLGVVVFLLLGGVLCLRSEGAAVPGPRTWRLLTDQAVHGWKDLLTTLPPVDGDGPLLVLPFVLGLVTGVLGAALVRWQHGPAWLQMLLPVLAPLTLLAGVILLGVRHPWSLAVQGAGFAVLALGWVALRAQRGAQQVAGRGRLRRVVAGGSLVALAGLVAVPAAGLATGDLGAERVVLRQYVDPPFDVGQYPSPLASFRRYVKDAQGGPTNLHDKDLMTVRGLPTGTRVRLATLDRYDGTVWGAANNSMPGVADDSFQRVSSTIDTAVRGRRVEATVTLADGYGGVWLPTAGYLTSMRFEGAEADRLAETFRYNLATGTAVAPTGLRPGQRYRFTAVLPDDRVTRDSYPGGDLPAGNAETPFLEAPSRKWTEGTSAPMARVFRAADHLRTQGRYSDGVRPSEQRYLPGHSLRRLDSGFVNADTQMVGNDEQYAAVMALLAQEIGVPARVVLGAQLPDDGVITGGDVHAWVELQVADGSWRTLPTEAFMGHEPPDRRRPRSQQRFTGRNVPPPAPVPPPSTLDEQTDAELKARKQRRADATTKKDDESLVAGVPVWVRRVAVYGGGPSLLVLLCLAGIVGVKAVRRRRRRHADRVSTRFDGGWRELVDHARDLGAEVPRGVTRSEQSAALAGVGSSGAATLARRADVSVFGPAVPDAAAAQDYWGAVDTERKAMSSSTGRARRWRAAVSLRSLRRGTGRG